MAADPRANAAPSQASLETSPKSVMILDWTSATYVTMLASPWHRLDRSSWIYYRRINAEKQCCRENCCQSYEPLVTIISKENQLIKKVAIL